MRTTLDTPTWRNTLSTPVAVSRQTDPLPDIPSGTTSDRRPCRRHEKEGDCWWAARLGCVLVKPCLRIPFQCGRFDRRDTVLPGSQSWPEATDPKLPTSVIFGSKAQLRHDAQQCGLDLTQRLRDSFQAALAVQENENGLRKKRYDQLHVKTDYAEGELVLLFEPQTQPGLARKLQCKWRGLFRIVQKTTSLNYVIRDLDTNKTQKVHIQRLRKYFPLPEHLLPTDDDETSKCTCRCA